MTRARRGCRATVAALAVAILLAACSGSDGGRSDASFTSAFERTTANYRQRTDALKQEARGTLGSGTGQVLTAYESMLGAVSDAHTQFNELRPPKSLVDDVDRLVGNLDQQERTLRSLIATVKANEGAQELGASLQELARLLVDFAKAHQVIQQQLG